MSQEGVEVLRGVRHRLSLPGERASQRRTVDERLFVRFPALYPRLADTLMRLLPRPRLRRLLLARVVRRAYAAGNRRDFDVLLMGFAPGIEFHPRPELVPPDQEAVVYGRDGYREMWRKWLDAFEDLRLEPEELVDLGERFLVTIQFRAHGSGSGVAVNQQVFQLFKLRRGLVVWQEDFDDRDKALEAAGLRVVAAVPEYG